MQIQTRFSALILTILLSLTMGVTAYAHEVPDTSRKGTVSVAMTYDGSAVPGGTLMLYRVGDVGADNGNYYFSLAGDFAGSNVSLDNLESPELAVSLGEYATSNHLNGVTVGIGNDGIGMIGDLTPGLYLVVQTKAADGYEAVMPFLVSVPMNENGTYVYDVDASPKVELKKEHKITTTTPPVPSNPTLPQTGQLKWPVPVLAILGLCMLLAGWALRFDKKEMSYET